MGSAMALAACATTGSSEALADNGDSTSTAVETSPVFNKDPYPST